MTKADSETYSDALTCAAKLLAWDAAKRRIGTADLDHALRAAAECILLSDRYRDNKA